ncbi:hypothetical protein [Streptomyces sp. AM6-12]|uniref:hypothetical protein n=1 Tax=Streptomyces sp. AM6-12 TaxID=3345149 RepID=UPI00379A5856
MIRKTASTINDADLDQLYDQLGRLQIANRALNTAALEAVQRAEHAEAAIARVRAIHSHGRRTNACNDCGQPWPCEVARALDQAAPTAATQATEPRNPNARQAVDHL